MARAIRCAVCGLTQHETDQREHESPTLSLGWIKRTLTGRDAHDACMDDEEVR